MNKIHSSNRLADPGMISGAAPLHSPHPSNQGQLQVIYGPMFSGKTTELIRRCKRFQLANYRCIVVKYAKDTRYSDKEVATHDRHTLAAMPAVNLRSIIANLLEYEVIAIDEGQFFPDIVPVSEELANEGKVVIVAALDGDFKREAFGSILELVPRAESVVKLNAVCMICYRTAAYTKRTSHDVAVEVIGGTDKYVAVCRECHRTDSENAINGAALEDRSVAPTVDQDEFKMAIRSPRKNQIMG